jgi:hypothetical protein
MAMTTLPRNVSALIGEYSKPITRADWRKCKHRYIDNLWDEILENNVYVNYTDKQWERKWSFKGNHIFTGRFRRFIEDYLPNLNILEFPFDVVYERQCKKEKKKYKKN